MDARPKTWHLLECLFAFFVIFSSALVAEGQQTFRADTENFVIFAPDSNLAKKAATLAEKYRRELSNDWLGYEIKPWREKCPIHIQLGPNAGGETSFAFIEGQQRGEPIGWRMQIFGPPDRVLDAVLPHEITHTIFATHFGQPLPRWADEGACTTVEHFSEREKNHRMLINFLTSSPSRGIPFNQMFTMKRYPHDILPLYAQGYSVARFLIGQHGRREFVKFLEAGLAIESSHNDTRSWDRVVNQFYGFKNLSDLQIKWLAWVGQGSPDLSDDKTGIAKSDAVPAGNATPESEVVQVNNVVPAFTNPAADEIERSNAQVLGHSSSWYVGQSRTNATEPKDALQGNSQSTSTQSDVELFASADEFLPGSVKRVKTTRQEASEISVNRQPLENPTVWR